MGALKDDDDIENDELEFDVKNDWRKDSDATKTNLFKEDDMECGDEELDTGTLTLDLNKELLKEEKKERAKADAKKRKESKKGNKKDAENTLKALQEAVEGDGSGQEDLEILSEEDQALVNDPIFNNKGDLYPQIHGNYFLLDHLVDGGMAKVCRARYLGEGDEADKMVAIKMVQEQYSKDEAFVQMFIDEIKVSFGLNHPNINTTFDYGKIGKNLFVSMEYIHGKDLMVLVNVLKKQKKTIPIPMAIFIASKMCEALHYAHNFTNKLTGQKYNIVHRDISPHNAMVSYEGYVKVIDFGIAKADTNEVEEKEGEIKGKINYFAPEYLEGKKIDHTYDQFAVGLTLWEMLTGEKTFQAPDQLLTLKKILECEPDLPSKYNKKIPKGLDLIVMKALSKDPANRHKNMQEFNKQLMKFLYTTYPDFHESDLSNLMKTLFKEDYEKDMAKFKEFGKYSISDIVEKIKAYKDFQKRQKEKAEASGKSREMVFDFGFEEEVSARGKGGRNIDSLMASRKKKKPSVSEAKERERRKRRYADLADDEDFQNPNSLDNHKGKILFLMLLVLGFFQKETILGLLFDSKEQAVQQQIQKINKRTNAIKKISKEHKENLNYLKELRKKQEEEKAAKARPVRQRPPEVPKPVQAATQPIEPPKPVDASERKAEVKVENVAKFKLEDIKKKNEDVVQKPVEAPKSVVAPQGKAEVQVENIAKFQLEDLKNPKEKVVEKPAEASKTVQAPPTKSEVVVEDPANFSIEDLKKRMKQQLEARKNKIQEAAPPPQPVEEREPASVAPVTEKGKLENQPPLREDLSIDDLRAKMKANLAELKEKNEVPPAGLAEENNVQATAPESSAEVETPEAPPAEVVTPESTPAAAATPVREMTDTEKELAALKAKMDSLMKKEQTVEEPKLEGKVSIGLSPQEQAAKEAEEKLRKAQIQKDLAKKLKSIESGEEPEVPEGKQAQSSSEAKDSAMGKVMNFIKSRKAFSWMFSD